MLDVGGDGFLEGGAAPLDQLAAGGQVHLRDFLAGGLFDGLQQSSLTRGHEQEGLAAAARPAGAADAVHVGLIIVGDVEVHDVADALHVQATGGHVGGDDDVQGTALELLHGAGADRLVHVTVQGRGGKTPRIELVGQFHRAGLGAHEDDHTVEVFHFENTGQGIQLVGALHQPVELLDFRIVAHRAGDADFLRIFQVLLGHRPDRFGHGGGEQRHLPVARGLLENRLDIVNEAHAQHFVGFVEHQGLELAEVHGAPIEVVKQTPGRTHHHVRAAAQAGQLTLHVLAAVDGQHVEAAHAGGVGLEGLGHLNCQFPRRAQHQRLGAHLRHVNVRQNRQGEGGGFAGTRLRHADHILA